MMNRRQFSSSLASAAALSSAGAAFAQPGVSAHSRWLPTKDVELVIPFAPGGGADIFARLVAQIMREEKLVPVAVQPSNKPGGGSAVGLGYVAANRSSDPHTLVLLNNAALITPLKVKNAPGWRELRPLVNIMADDFLIIVRADSKWKTFADLAAEAKKLPPKSIAFAVGGTGDEMGTNMLGRMLGVKFNIISFSGGGETSNALLGGHVQATIGNPIEWLGQMDAKTVRAIGTLRESRFPTLPDIPTLKELGFAPPPFQNFRGIAAPKGVPDEVADYWQDVLIRVAASDRMKKYLADNAATYRVVAAQDYLRFIGQQEAIYQEILK